MENGITEDLHRLQFAGKSIASRIGSLSHAHAALLELEAKEQLRKILIIFMASTFAVVVGGVALVLGSFALAGTLNSTWPALGVNLSLVLVAIGLVIVMIIILHFVKAFQKQITLIGLESVQSWKESVLCVLRGI